MTARGGKTATEKLGDWKTVFDGIAEDLTPQSWREMAALAKPTGSPVEIQLGVQIAKLVAANDRAAAIAAAIITQSGVVRPVIEEGEAD